MLVIFHFAVNFEVATSLTNTSVIQSSNAFLSCEFYGTEIINITWTASDGSVITSDLSHATIISSSSSTRASSSLQFANVNRAQSEGWYTCTAYSYNNDRIIVTLSSHAYLNVQGMFTTHMFVTIANYLLFLQL